MRKATILSIILPAVLHAQQVKPRILFDVDTSGSMGWDVCDPSAVGDVDHTNDCPGSDVSCDPLHPQGGCPGAVGCGNGIPDDGRLWKVKRAITDVVTAFGEVEFGLARFHQDPIVHACIGGGWEGADLVSCNLNPLGTGDNAADILVKFDDSNRTQNILEWLDLDPNFPGTPPPTGCALCDDCGAGCDKELRPTGNTPIAGSIVSCKNYLDEVRNTDPQTDCRPYGLIVLSDGANNCDDPENPANQTPEVGKAADVCADGIPVHVIGFSSPAIADRLNLIADAGCSASCDPNYGTPQQTCRETAILVDNEADLALAFAQIIQSSIRVELCNGEDDDCDGLTDEDFVTLGATCGKGRCEGSICCDPLDPTQTATTCCGLTPTCETCNRADDDCDGVVDNNIDEDCDGVVDVPQVPCTCYPEECNGYDDDCDCPGDTNGDGTVCGPGDANVDEEPLATSGFPCGTDQGECVSGRTCCENSTPTCCGEVGPTLEICDCLDNDCNGFTDERNDAPCFTLGDGCDPATGLCEGICLLGAQECVDIDPGPGCIPGAGECLGERGPETEACNCIDDDCDGDTDEDVICPGGGRCENCVCPLNCDPSDEFPCAAGFNCECAPDSGPPPCDCGDDARQNPDCADNWFCQVDLCIGVTCGPCEFCDAAAGGVCKDLCGNAIECESWQECRCNVCVDVSCTNPQETTCGENETCNPDTHECERDACLDANCGDGEYCRTDSACAETPDDLCVPVCPRCVDEQKCVCGLCVDDPCANVQCLPNQVCCTGECIQDPCVTVECEPGQRCDSCTGGCLPDNCALRRIECPDDYICYRDECVPEDEAPGREDVLSVSGAGGCACRIASQPETPKPPWLLLVGLALALVGRRSCQD